MSETKFQVIDQRVVAELAQQATASPRKRSHLILHSDHNDHVQRLVIVLQPGSYVRPHQHSEQWEVLVLLQGRGELLNFSPAGEVLARVEMSPQSPVAQIPIGEWHTFLVLEPDTAVMEIKPGPYRPNEFADWAPAEGDPRVPEFMRKLSKP